MVHTPSFLYTMFTDMDLMFPITLTESLSSQPSTEFRRWQDFEISAAIAATLIASTAATAAYAAALIQSGSTATALQQTIYTFSDLFYGLTSLTTITFDGIHNLQA